MDHIREGQQTSARALELDSKAQLLETDLRETKDKLKWAEEFREKAEEEATKQTREVSRLHAADQRLTRERERVKNLVAENERLAALLESTKTKKPTQRSKKRSKRGD